MDANNLLADPVAIEIEKFVSHGDSVTIVVRSVQPAARCPLCWQRGYVYLGAQLLAVQQGAAVHWVHQDPVTKSQRVTSQSGAVESTVDLDPWGGETTVGVNAAFQPRRFTTYERDGNQSDDAMARRYNRWWSRFDQPDPYGGSYDLTNPQSLNRYSYVQNDPVNLVDPTGLFCGPGTTYDGNGGCVNWDTPAPESAPDYSGLLGLIFGQFGLNPYLPQPELVSPGVGGGGGTDPMPPQTRTNNERTRAALDGCLRDLFAVSLTLYTPSGRGRNGNIHVNFTNSNRTISGLTGFGVVNDATSYSGAQLGSLQRFSLACD